MNKRQKTKPKLINPDREVMVLHHQLQQQDLLKKNQILLKVVFALMLVVFVLGSYFLPAQTMVENLKEKQQEKMATVEDLKNPVLAAEIDSLKSQLVSLVSGSIENKLTSLEKSIKQGSVLNSLETVHHLKEDLKILRTYSDPQQQKKQEVAAREILTHEVSQLKKLVYLMLGSCGLMFAALAGIWVKTRQQLISPLPRYLEKKN